MRKKLLTILGVLILLTSLATVAFADKPIQLLINGSVVKTDIPPQLIEGRVMAPVRWVAEALGTDVNWNESTRSVIINTPELASLQSRVNLLQNALSPSTPKEAVEKWAKGVKERNGALQFAVLSPEFKEQRLSVYESFNWVTGTSSPWVERYEITKETQTGDTTWEYEVRYEYATSTGPAGSGKQKIVVKQYENAWYITQLDGEKGFPIVVPAGWSKKYDGALEIEFLNEKGVTQGGFFRVGYYADQPLSTSLPNHSLQLSIEDVDTPLGKGKLVVLERDHPAASGNDEVWQEIHAIIPIVNEKLAYDFWIRVDGLSTEKTKAVLKNILAQTE